MLYLDMDIRVKRPALFKMTETRKEPLHLVEIFCPAEYLHMLRNGPRLFIQVTQVFSSSENRAN